MRNLNLAKLILSKQILVILTVAATTIAVITAQQFVSKNKEDTGQILVSTPASKIVFPNLEDSKKERVDGLIREQVRLIVSKATFAESLKVAKKHQNKIRTEATLVKFPPQLALGVALLENGGSETAVSYAGAAGIFQLTENTAKTLGLKINEATDERLEPEKNIAAGIAYLDQNLQIFSDPGIAVWAHHAGTQNVSKALKIYLQSLGEVDAFDYLEAEKLGKLDRAKYVWRAYVTHDNLNIHKLLSSPQVAQFLTKFQDETELYPYKVVAAAVLFEASENIEEDKFLEKVRLFNQGRILLTDLLTPN